MAHRTTPREQMQDVLRSFRTAMLVTRTPGDELKARPMSIASIEPEGEIWFVTSLDSQKANEVLRDRRVVVALQSPSRFMSISGDGEVLVNPARAAELWNESFRPFFPDGPSDPKLALVHVHARFAEFWDLSGLQGVRYLFKAMQHAMKGERMSDAPDEHHASMHLG